MEAEAVAAAARGRRARSEAAPAAAAGASAKVDAPGEHQQQTRPPPPGPRVRVDERVERHEVRGQARLGDHPLDERQRERQRGLLERLAAGAAGDAGDAGDAGARVLVPLLSSSCLPASFLLLLLLPGPRGDVDERGPAVDVGLDAARAHLFEEG